MVRGGPRSCRVTHPARLRGVPPRGGRAAQGRAGRRVAHGVGVGVGLRLRGGNLAVVRYGVESRSQWTGAGAQKHALRSNPDELIWALLCVDYLLTFRPLLHISWFQQNEFIRNVCRLQTTFRERGLS